jgi:hypothetical protein
MSALLEAAAPEVRPVHDVRRRVVLALAAIEARRQLRSPLLWLGLALSAAFLWQSLRAPGDWSGALYSMLPIVVGPLVAALSMVVAGSFHRERIELPGAGPVDEETRAAGRLLGSMASVAVVVVATVAAATAARLHGGFDLGDEPGRTLHAQYSWPEILQPVCLALLAVGAGSAAGRRFRRRATAALTLFVAWFPVVLVAWAFAAPQVTPFSIIQLQPISVEIGPSDADPLSFPSSWLLSAPGEYQDHWARAFTSIPLGIGHNVWLLGLALTLTGLALPRRRALPVVACGILLGTVGVVTQFLVIP